MLCHTMTCFEQNIHITRSPVEISYRAIRFVGIKKWTLLLCSMTHYDITIGNDVARDVHCEIIRSHGIHMDTYHDVPMPSDVTRPSFIMYYNAQL